jgi:hypothetical protein
VLLTGRPDTTNPRRARADRWRWRRGSLKSRPCSLHGASNVNRSRVRSARSCLPYLHQVLSALLIGHGAVCLLSAIGIVAGVHVVDCLGLPLLCCHAAGERKRDAAEHQSSFHRSAPCLPTRPTHSVGEGNAPCPLSALLVVWRSGLAIARACTGILYLNGEG